MKIFVNAKPGSRKKSIEKIDETHFNISVKEAPYKGLANKAVAEALAEFFKLPKSKVFLKTGFSSSQKVFEVVF